MAVDKLVDSTQLDTDLTSVANAIRTKGGTSAQLAFPSEFVAAINAISSTCEAISVVDTPDVHGGTIRTITAVDISDTTAVAADVADGKYFYTANGVKTVGTGSGSGTGTASISVVYKAKKTIYSDSSISDIKENLEVRLHTASLPDGAVLRSDQYTLTGTVTAGTQTFTVTFEELTDTVDVYVVGVGSTNYASALSNWLISSTEVVKYASNVIVMYATNPNNWSTSTNGTPGTNWSTVLHKFLRIRFTVCAPNWSGAKSTSEPMNAVYFGVGLYNSNTRQIYDDLDNVALTPEPKVYEYIRSAEESSMGQGSGTITSSTMYRPFIYSSTPNVVCITGCEIVEVSSNSFNSFSGQYFGTSTYDAQIIYSNSELFYKANTTNGDMVYGMASGDHLPIAKNPNDTSGNTWTIYPLRVPDTASKIFVDTKGYSSQGILAVWDEQLEHGWKRISSNGWTEASYTINIGDYIQYDGPYYFVLNCGAGSQTADKSDWIITWI